MRSRISILAAGAVSFALLLSGCASDSGTPAATDAAAEGPQANAEELLTAEDVVMADGGAAVDAMVVSENFGDTPEVTMPSIDLIGDTAERRVVVEGDGPLITPESQVLVKIQETDLTTDASSDFAAIQSLVTLGDGQLIALIPAALYDVPSGSRVALVVPGDVMSEATGGAAVNPMAVVMDVVAIEETVATGEPTGAATELVTVSENPGEAPTIEVHSDQPEPTAQVIEPVLLGDGAVVGEGDTVVVQYTGLLYADGTEFDSSWTRGGTPSVFPTTGVVPGFANALVGQTVGSRVYTVFPADLGYGDDDTASIPGGSTLVFVIDILGTL